MSQKFLHHGSRHYNVQEAPKWGIDALQTVGDFPSVAICLLFPTAVQLPSQHNPWTRRATQQDTFSPLERSVMGSVTHPALL